MSLQPKYATGYPTTEQALKDIAGMSVAEKDRLAGALDRKPCPLGITASSRCMDIRS